MSQLSLDKEKVINYNKKRKENDKEATDEELLKTVEKILS